MPREQLADPSITTAMDGGAVGIRKSLKYLSKTKSRKSSPTRAVRNVGGGVGWGSDKNSVSETSIEMHKISCSSPASQSIPTSDSTSASITSPINNGDEAASPKESETCLVPRSVERNDPWANLRSLLCLPYQNGPFGNFPSGVFCPAENNENITAGGGAKATWNSPTGNSMMTDASAPAGVSNIAQDFDAEVTRSDDDKERVARNGRFDTIDVRQEDGSISGESEVDESDGDSTENSASSLHQDTKELISIILNGEDETITIDLNNVHFSGWDGERSHYTVSMPEDDAKSLAATSSPTRSTTGRKSKGAKDGAVVSPNAARFAQFSPASHPLKATPSGSQQSMEMESNHPGSSKKKKKTAVENNAKSPIIHVVPQKLSHASPNGAATSISPINSDPTQSFIPEKIDQIQSFPSGELNEALDRGARMAASLFSMLLKCPHDDHHDRRIHAKLKDKLVTAEHDNLNTPMGEEESDMILNFLASSSSGSTNENKVQQDGAPHNIHSVDSAKDKQYSTPIAMTTNNGRPPLSQNCNHTVREQSEKKRTSKGNNAIGNEICSHQSQSSNLNSAQTKSSRHRRTNGAASATVFFSPNNTYTLEVEDEGNVYLKAVASSRRDSPRRGRGKNGNGATKLVNRSGGRTMADKQRRALQKGWRHVSATASDILQIIPVVTCDSREEEEMSPMMADDYSPAVMYEKSLQKNVSGDNKEHDMHDRECTPIQRSSLKLKTNRAKKWADDYVGKKGMEGGKKMKLPFFRQHESVNVNLFGAGVKDGQKKEDEYCPRPHFSEGQRKTRPIMKEAIDDGVEWNVSLYLPKCSPHIQWQNLNAGGGKCVLEGWMAVSCGGNPVKRMKKAGRSALKYVVLFDSPPKLLVFKLPTDASAHHVIDLSLGQAISPVLVSKKMGQCICIKDKTTEKVTCALLPMSLESSVFGDDGNRALLSGQQENLDSGGGAVLCKNIMSSQRSLRQSLSKVSQWGDGEHLGQNFAPIEQHWACLHVLYIINTIMFKFAKSGGVVSSNESFEEVFIKILVS